MSEDTQEEIERLKQQLEKVKLQDGILEEIETMFSFFVVLSNLLVLKFFE